MNGILFYWSARQWGRRSLFQVLMVAALFVGFPLLAEDKFEVLDMGSGTFSNITIVSRTKTHITFTHEHGFSTVKLTDLSSNTLVALGYRLAPPKPPRRTLTIPKEIKTDPRVEAARGQVLALVKQASGKMNTTVVIGVITGMLLLYLLFCYAAQLICQKAGQKPNGLVWLPVLQWFPLLKAAKMSGWNFVLLLLFPISIVVYLVWCVKICQARGKNPVWALLLFFPFTTALAFLYLGFSDGDNDEKKGSGKIQLAYQ